MIYKDQLDSIVERYKSGSISQNEAVDEIFEVETYWSSLQGSEPDGDIPLSASDALDKVGFTDSQ